MERVLILGSNGGGKSTFSFRLAALTGLPLVHIDQIYWHGNWEVTPTEVFQARVLAEAQKPRWIIEGNNVRSLDQRLQYADTAFWFELPPRRCLWNICKREWKYRRRARPDMPDSCISRFQLSFLRYAAGFNRSNHDRIAVMLAQYPNLMVYHITSHRQAEQLLHDLSIGREGPT